MKKLTLVSFSWYKFINLLLLLLVGLYLWLYPHFISSGGCLADWCTYDIRVGLLYPLYIASKYFIYIPLVLIFLPAKYFKRWLLYVASWSIPFTFLAISQTSTYSSGIMSGRDFDAFFASIILVVISAISIILFLAFDIYKWYRSGI